MPTTSEILGALVEILDSSVMNANSSAPAIQRRAYSELQDELAKLEIKNGVIRASSKNIRMINRIVRRFERILMNTGYRDLVKGFAKSFNLVTKTQTAYFQSAIEAFTIPVTLNALQETAIEDTVSLMAKDGLQTEVLEGVRQILSSNVKSGSTIVDLQSQLKGYITGTESTVGALDSFVGRVTTDSINMYSSSYNDTVATNLGLEWYQYVGSLVSDSRPFCKALVKKRWFHKSEIPGFLKGHVGNVRVKRSSSTGLPEGMKRGTNKTNFQIYRGGWRCNHLMMPVPSSNVPKRIRDAQ